MRRPPLCSSTYYNLTALCQCSTSATHTHKRTNPETVLLAASKPLCISSRSSSSLEHITCSCKHLAHALLFSPGGRTSLESALPPGPLFCVFSDFMLKATQTQECVALSLTVSAARGWGSIVAALTGKSLGHCQQGGGNNWTFTDMLCTRGAGPEGGVLWKLCTFVCACPSVSSVHD